MGIGLALKYFRLKAGLKQKELAKKAKTSPTYLSLVETEKRTPSIGFLNRIATELKIPVELLVIEAAQQRGELTANQSELFDRAKSLVRLAATIERHDHSGSSPRASAT